jgi:uncharacterized protein (DUF4415 family)/uncharacterized DUF497 family protein
MRLEWDEAKRAANLAKHGIDFSLAEQFDFESAKIGPDERRDYGEPRDIALGVIGSRVHVLILPCAARRSGSSVCARRILGRSSRMAKRKPKNISQKDWDAVSSLPLTAAQLRRLRPASEVLPGLVESYRRSRGRPKLAHPKDLVSLRIDADVIAAFKSDGPGWQTRMNAVLAKWARRKVGA